MKLAAVSEGVVGGELEGFTDRSHDLEHFWLEGVVMALGVSSLETEPLSCLCRDVESGPLLAGDRFRTVDNVDDDPFGLKFG